MKISCLHLFLSSSFFFLFIMYRYLLSTYLNIRSCIWYLGFRGDSKVTMPMIKTFLSEQSYCKVLVQVLAVLLYSPIQQFSMKILFQHHLVHYAMFHYALGFNLQSYLFPHSLIFKRVCHELTSLLVSNFSSNPPPLSSFLAYPSSCCWHLMMILEVLTCL